MPVQKNISPNHLINHTTFSQRASLTNTTRVVNFSFGRMRHYVTWVTNTDTDRPLSPRLRASNELRILAGRDRWNCGSWKWKLDKYYLYLFRKILIWKTYKNLNVAGLEPAPPGNRPGALTTEPYVRHS